MKNNVAISVFIILKNFNNDSTIRVYLCNLITACHFTQKKKTNASAVSADDCNKKEVKRRLQTELKLDSF
jgi:hypothetical protein